MSYNKVTDRLIKELEHIVGSENLTTKPEELYCYSFDGTIQHHIPEVVVRPKDTSQVSEIVKLANREKIPITPRGSGTGLSGATIPTFGGIVMDTTRMNQILDIDIENMIAIVEAGVICDGLNAELAKYGYCFPPDPGSSSICTIGGMVGTNAGGNKALKYGVTKDHVLWLEVVLPSGEIIKTGSHVLKSSSALDITRLMIGSEGVLGIVTKVGIKLTPLPKYTSTELFLFDAVAAAAKAVVKVRVAGIVPTMLEFMDLPTTEATFEYAGLEGYPEGYYLLLECDGFHQEAVESEFTKAVEFSMTEKPIYYEKAEDLKHRDKLLSARKSALPALSRLRPTTCIEDCTVLVTKLPEAAMKIEEIPSQLGVEGFGLGNFGHVGDGNMHPTFFFDERVDSQREAFYKALDILYKDIVIPLGGSITGEHGLGIVKTPYIGHELGSTVKIWYDIKKLLDPNLILNPGKGKGGPYPLVCE